MAKPGVTLKFPIYLTSLDELTDMTFQLTFPERLLPVLTVEDIEVSDQAKGYTVSVSPGDGVNAYVISLIGGSIHDVNTALLTFTIHVPEDIITAQNYQVTINQVSVTETDGNTLTASTRNGRISVYKNGDANGDDTVDIVDVTSIISSILGDTPDVFINEVANTNDDDGIDVVDVTTTIDIILQGEGAQSASARETNMDPE